MNNISEVGQIENTLSRDQESRSQDKILSTSLSNWNGKKINIDQDTKRVGFLNLPEVLHDMIAKFLVPVENYCEYFYGRAEGGIIGPVCKALRNVNRNLLRQSPERVAVILKKIKCDMDNNITPQGNRMLQEIATSVHTLDLRQIPLSVYEHSTTIKNLLKYFLNTTTIKHSNIFQRSTSVYLNENVKLETSEISKEIISKTIPLVDRFVYPVTDNKSTFVPNKLIKLFQNLSNLKTLILEIGYVDENVLLETVSIIVSIVPDLHELYCCFYNSKYSNNIYNLINKFTNLRELSIADMNDSLKNIGSLKHLEILILSSVNQDTVDNLHYLNELKKLKKLTLYKIENDDTPIIINNYSKKFEFLNFLDEFSSHIEFNFESMKIVISQLLNLEIFICQGKQNSINFLSIINSISNSKETINLLSKLKKLNLDTDEDTEFSTDTLESIKHFYMLEDLSINWATSEILNQYVHLTSLRKLESTYIRFFSSENLDVISKLLNLRELAIGWSNSDISNIDIVLQKFSTLPHLEVLDMYPMQSLDPDDPLKPLNIEQVQFIIDNFKTLEFLSIPFDEEHVNKSVHLWKKFVLEKQKTKIEIVNT